MADTPANLQYSRDHAPADPVDADAYRTLVGA
jgi:hypothetical protein